MPFLFQGPPGQDGISGPAGDRGPPVSDHTHKAQRCGDPTPHPSLVCRAPWEHLVPPVQGEKTEIRDPRAHQAYLVPLAPRELRQVDGPPSLSRGTHRLLSTCRERLATQAPRVFKGTREFLYVGSHGNWCAVASVHVSGH